MGLPASPEGYAGGLPWQPSHCMNAVEFHAGDVAYAGCSWPVLWQ